MSLNVQVEQQVDNQSPSENYQQSTDNQFNNNSTNNNNKLEYSEEEDDDPEQLNRLPENLLPKQSQKQKLIQQNIKLKAQIYQLALQLDEIINRDKQKKKKYTNTIYNYVEDDDQAIRAAKLALKSQQLTVMQLKNTIFELKRQLDSVYNSSIVQEKQDILKDLRRKLEEIEEQRDGLLKIKKGQVKAIKTIKNQEEYKQKIQKTHKEYIKKKQDTQKLIEKVLEARKKQIACHEKYVLKRNKIRQLQSKMATNKEKGNKNKNSNSNNNIPINKDTISNQMITELEEEIKQLDKDKKEGEKVWQDKIRAVEGQLQNRRQQQEKKMLTLREKQKQYKLNQIRIRQLRKLVKQNIVADNMNEQKKKGQQMDMSQFRHKRNIRYMDK